MTDWDLMTVSVSTQISCFRKLWVAVVAVKNLKLIRKLKMLRVANMQNETITKNNAHFRKLNKDITMKLQLE